MATWIVGGVVALIVILIGILSEEKDFNFLLVAIIPFVTLFFAIKEVINMKKNRAYRIEEDRVVGSEIKTTYDVVDAVTNHMPTKTPALYFDKYGEYPVNSMHIHPYYSPQEIVNEIENGEKVYIVFSKDKDKILHIYRKKFWKLEQK